jgi:hypothetical protein
MTTAEERLRILKMIEEGKISADEGAELLQALRTGEGGGKRRPGGEKRWLRVRITDLDSGQAKVSVNIPVSLVEVGLKMGARFAPNVEGFDFDEVMEMIRQGAEGRLVDVVDQVDGERVEVFVE